MTAIYKKELKSYLTSMVGYLFMAFTLALFGLYFTAINLQQGYRIMQPKQHLSRMKLTQSCSDQDWKIP